MEQRIKIEMNNLLLFFNTIVTVGYKLHCAAILLETVWRPLLKNESIAFQLFQVHYFSLSSPV